jgi:hypothetical protein
VEVSGLVQRFQYSVLQKIPRDLVFNFVSENYEEKSVNRSQMDTKCKTCDRYVILEKKTLFLDITSTNVDTHVPSLYQCVETHSIEVL